jgi:hypothetical protein
MNLYSGVKGNFTRDVSFNFRVAYSIIDDMHFFVNDNIGALGNKFSVVYDNVELLHYSGEIGADISGRIGFLGSVNYRKYGMKGLQQHPWHRPALDMKFTANYNLADKVLLSADVFYIGKRYALLQGRGDSEVKELKGVADVNLGLEYRYNTILSGFIRMTNLSNTRYSRWNNYPVQGFSIMAGFSYSL